MVDTRERHGLDESSPWWGEHVGRYHWVTQYVKDRFVLDAACGSGYGSDIIAKNNTRRVVGVDISEDAIQFSKQKFQNSKVGFLQANVEKLPFKNNLFDLVVSFETLEHIHRPKSFIRESARILKKDGLFICSTPNAEFYKNDEYKNPFHVHEFTIDELKDTLSKHFRKIDFFYQINNREMNSSMYSKLIWKFLALRGIRKMPYKTRNFISRILTKKSVYPRGEDYRFFSNHTVMIAPVILAVCSMQIGA